MIPAQSSCIYTFIIRNTYLLLLLRVTFEGTFVYMYTFKSYEGI